MMRVIQAAILITVLSAFPAHAGSSLKTTEVCVKGQCVIAEIADTDEARSLGLMHRDRIPEGKGMLFVFPSPGRYAFWMMNMKIPIDIIWIGMDKRIVDIKSSVPPCSGSCPGISPPEDALYVLELRSGFAEDHNINTGDVVSIGESHS